MKPVLSLENLQKSYGRGSKALQGISLNVMEGQFVGFFGPNGAGKTTTIKILMNLIPPTRGTARVLGQPSHLLGVSELERIGYVSENQELPGWMTLKEWLGYCRPLYPNWREDVCGELREKFDLPLDQKLSGFSRGMRMKAALLSSLSYLPELVILDEPFSGLDPLARDQFVEGLMDLAEKKPFTLFLSTHDVAEVERLCDTVAFLRAGQLDLVESTESLLKRFRRIDGRVPKDTMISRSLPRMKQVEQEGEHIRYVSSDFESEAGETAKLRELSSESRLSSVAPMSLRDIIVALCGTEGIEGIQP